jgi:hypothetical protein
VVKGDAGFCFLTNVASSGQQDTPLCLSFDSLGDFPLRSQQERLSSVLVLAVLVSAEAKFSPEPSHRAVAAAGLLFRRDQCAVAGHASPDAVAFDPRIGVAGTYYVVFAFIRA